MEIQIVEQEKKLQVVIRCQRMNEQVNRLKAHIEVKKK